MKLKTAKSLLFAVVVILLPLVWVSLIIWLVCGVPFANAILYAWVGEMAYEAYALKKRMMDNFDKKRLAEREKESASANDQ